MYFIVRETVLKKGKYGIYGTEKLFSHIGKCIGSYQVAQSRIMGLNYADYLRYLRDKHGATLLKSCWLYPSAVFNSEDDAKEILHLLNTRAREFFRGRK